MRLTKVEVLRETIKIVVSALSEKSVPVTQAGKAAFVEWHPVTGQPKRINIPYVPDNASDRLIKAVQGFVDHEVAHVLFTDFNCVKAAIKSGAGMVGNILEDTYIEREMKKLYAGSRHNLLEVWGFVADEMLQKPLDAAIDEGHRAKIVATGLPIAIHAWAGNEAAEEFMATRWEAFADIQKIIGSDIIEQIPAINSSNEGLLLAVAIKNRLMEWKEKEEKEERERRKKEREEAEKEKGEPEPGESDGEPEPDGGKSDPSMDDVLDPETSDSGEPDPEAPHDDEGEEDTSGDEECEEGESGDEEEEDGDSEGDDEEDDEEFRSPDPRTDDAPEESESEEETEEEDDEEGGDKADTGEDAADKDSEDADKDGEDSKGEEEERGSTSPEGPPEPTEEKEEEDLEDFESEAEEILDAMEDMKDMESLTNELIGEEMDKALGSVDYWPLTKDADIIERYTPKNTDSSYVRRRQEDIAKHIGQLTKHLQRIIQARSYDRKIPGFRSGKLDGASLHRVPTGDDRVFRRVHKMTTKDVDVQLVVDLSGSMAGGKVELATEVAYAVGLPLDRLGINNQIIGFTTADMNLVTHHRDIADREDGRRPSRYEPIYMPILKDWSQNFTADRQSAVIMAAKDVRLRNNIDGECIEYAGRMLWAQPAARKLMIVLSDGCPSAHGDYREQAVHLRRVVKRLEAVGTEVFGLGIMDDSVKRFYKNAVVIRKMEEVLTTVMGVLEAMLMRGAL